MTAATALDASASALADDLIYTAVGGTSLESAEAALGKAERLKRLAEAMAVQARVEMFRVHRAQGLAEWAPESIAQAEECSPQAAGDRLGWSLRLFDDLPVTWALLREGHLPVVTARTIAEQAAILDHAECAALEERLWPDGDDTIPSASARLAHVALRKCQRWIPVIHAGDVPTKVLTAARQERDVWLSAGEPGTDMSVLTASLTTPDGEVVLAQLNAVADAAGPDDPRSRGMLRADALVEHVTGQTSFALWADNGTSTPLPLAQHFTASITVPLDVLVAGAQTAGTIGGSVVTSTTAHLVAEQAIRAGGRITRLVSDPLSGALVDITLQRQTRPTTGPPRDPGPPPPPPPPSSLSSLLTPENLQAISAALSSSTASSIATTVEPQYEPSEALARFVRARDQHCQHPGCRVPATRCDLDHIQPWSGGGLTTAANLICLCRHHHRLKHQSPWTLRRLPDGAAQWTTPTRRTVRVEPPAPSG